MCIGGGSCSINNTSLTQLCLVCYISCVNTAVSPTTVYHAHDVVQHVKTPPSGAPDYLIIMLQITITSEQQTVMWQCNRKNAGKTVSL